LARLNTMNILYIGPEGSHTTSRHRANALRRLGHEVEIVDPGAVLPANRILRQVNVRSGYRLFTRAILRLIQERVRDRRFDLAWINGGYAISAECVRWIKTRAGVTVSYCNDDPAGPRDPSKWSTFRRAIPDYDLCVVVREFNRKEFFDLGAKNVLRVRMSYDEVAHSPPPFSAEDEAKWSSEVVFAGTWMPERGPFMEELIRRGVPLAIYGPRWEKAREWQAIKPHWRGAFASGPDYIKAIQYSKVALGLLSKGNRDTHTQRTGEIPFIGTPLCAERTAEHLEMFAEGSEALFWETPEECAKHCSLLLGDESFRQGLARAGKERILSSRLGNEDICSAVISRLPQRESALQHAGRDA